jgi:tagatose-1,6-bisphosphate aldolase
MLYQSTLFIAQQQSASKLLCGGRCWGSVVDEIRALRELVTRVLNELQLAGLVELGRGLAHHLHDVSGLQSHLDE